MKIYSDYALNDYPNAVKVIDWDPDTEECGEDTYHNFRVPQSKMEGSWFRNLEVISKETLDNGENYHPSIRFATFYHLTYERKHEYYYVEIGDSIKDLIDFMDKNNGYEMGLSLKDGKLWWEYMGE